MTNKERITRCAQNLPIDRAPFFFYFGPWMETVQNWEAEGITDPNAWHSEEFGFDTGILDLSEHVNLLYQPYFEEKILSRENGRVVIMDRYGVISESISGKSGIPHILKNPVTCRSDWDQIKKERLNPNDPARFSPKYREFIRHAKESDAAIQIGKYPFGLFGTLRDMIGVEELCYLFYDDPELIHDMMDDLTDFWLAIYEQVSADIQIDIIHIWEDMSGKTGSLISPAMVREFMMPNYQKICDFARRHQIPVIAVDTDGICDQLIPLFIESGINLLMPIEIAAGNNLQDLKKRFPEISLMGGIDKMEIAKGKEAIDAQLDLLDPLLQESGYFPALDHLIPPEVSWENYHYFVTQLRKRIMQYAK